MDSRIYYKFKTHFTSITTLKDVKGRLYVSGKLNDTLYTVSFEDGLYKMTENGRTLINNVSSSKDVIDRMESIKSVNNDHDTMVRAVKAIDY